MSNRNGLVLPMLGPLVVLEVLQLEGWVQNYNTGEANTIQ